MIKVKEIVNSLTIRQRILELLMLDVRFFQDENNEQYSVTGLPEQIADLFQEYPVGGVILFRENLQNTTEILNLTNELQKYTNFGRLIATDQEGGAVTRIYGASEMPGNMALGAINDTSITRKVAEVMGVELSSLGVNFAFAPVLDVNSNPKNPIIGVRSFGSDANLVAQHGVAYCDGLKHSHIISCGKHFPGHGDTDSDSHHSLPTINKSFSAFEKLDLIPFEAVINKKIDSIMTAHIVFPDLDDEKIFSKKTNAYLAKPATFSNIILTDLLRNKMRFSGVVVSDALDMKAIADNFDAVEATINCIKAGVDIVLMPCRLWSEQNIQEFKLYIQQIEQICTLSNELLNRVNESCERVLSLKFNYDCKNIKYDEDLSSKFNIMKSTLLDKNHKLFQESISAKAITLQKNITNTLPWVSGKFETILIISLNSVLSDDAVLALKELRYNNIIVKFYNEVIADDIYAANKILLLTYNLIGFDETITKIIDMLNENNKQYVMISCHNPYDINYLSQATTNVLVFGSSGVDQTNYSVRTFSLNMIQAIRKIMTATLISDFNHHIPVDLSIKNDVDITQ